LQLRFYQIIFGHHYLELVFNIIHARCKNKGASIAFYCCQIYSR